MLDKKKQILFINVITEYFLWLIGLNVIISTKINKIYYLLLFFIRTINYKTYFVITFKNVHCTV